MSSMVPEPKQEQSPIPPTDQILLLILEELQTLNDTISTSLGHGNNRSSSTEDDN